MMGMMIESAVNAASVVYTQASILATGDLCIFYASRLWPTPAYGTGSMLSSRLLCGR